jgi:hypothetical protein
LTRDIELAGLAIRLPVETKPSSDLNDGDPTEVVFPDFDLMGETGSDF